MTLEQAIKHAEEVAEEKDMQAGFETDYLCYQMSDTERNQCKKCAEEHRQLAEWLKDYKRLLEQEPKQGYCKDCKHMRYGSHPFERTIECSKDILLCPNDNVFCSKYERW